MDATVARGEYLEQGWNKQSTTHVVGHLPVVSGSPVNNPTFYRARLRFVSHNRLAA